MGRVPQADSDSPRRGSGRHACCSKRRPSSTRAISDTTAFLMSTMMADVINAGTGARRAQPRVHAAGRRQDRHDERFQRRLVRRIHAEARDRRLGRIRSAAHDSAERLCRRRRRAALGEVHEGRDAGDKPEWFVPPPGITTASVCRLTGKLATDELSRMSRSSNKDGELEHRSTVYTEYFARGTEPTEYCDVAPAARHSWRRSRTSSADSSRRPRRASTVRAPSAAGTAGRATRGDSGTTAPEHDRDNRPSVDAPQKPAQARLLVEDLRRRRRDENDRKTSRRPQEDGRAAVQPTETAVRHPVIRCRYRAVSGHRRPSAPRRTARAIDRAAGRCRPACSLPAPRALRKRQTALAVAQTLNCLDPRAGRLTPAARPMHRRVRRLRLVRRASRAASIRTSSSSSRATPASIKIDQVRDIVDRAAFRPFEGPPPCGHHRRRGRADGPPRRTRC